MTITDKDREAAVLALWGDVLYGQPPAELASAPDVQPIAQAIAQARAEVRAEERERCIRAMCWRCDHEAQFGTYQTVNNLNGWVHCEGTHYRWRCDANNLRDGQESWMQSSAIRGPQERSDEDRSRARGEKGKD